jgi:two-component system nitrate/nitrite response regulator NarL
MNVARVLVVHDQRIVAETIARRLEEEDEIRVVGIATSNAAGRSAAESVGPDVAVIDVEQAHGAVAADLVKYFTTLERPVKVVAILDDDDWVLAAQIIRAGADAVMTNDDAVNNLIAAVLTVAQGHAWVVPRILGGVLREFRASRPQPNEFDRRLELLTTREREVLRRMVSGSDHATIARELVVSVNTVRTHSQRILSKLEVHSGLEAVSVVRQSRTGGAL